MKTTELQQKLAAIKAENKKLRKQLKDQVIVLYEKPRKLE